MFFHTKAGYFMASSIYEISRLIEEIQVQGRFLCIEEIINPQTFMIILKFYTALRTKTFGLQYQDVFPLKGK
jgi:hypothetical protein